MDFEAIIKYKFEEIIIPSIKNSQDVENTLIELSKLLEVELKLFIYNCQKLNKVEKEIVYEKYILTPEQEKTPRYVNAIVSDFDYSYYNLLFDFNYFKILLYLNLNHKFYSQLSIGLTKIYNKEKFKNIPKLTQPQIAFFFQLLRGSSLRPLSNNINQHCKELCAEFNFLYAKRISIYFNQSIDEYSKKKVIELFVPSLPNEIKLPIIEFIETVKDDIYSNSYQC
jgi:hypothetical protein